ncbi:hypothetical protein HMPREF1347_00851 [Enterococcus faecium 504]|nr:hypothetical protein HMPREF1347_00851 [Enterococcus faecium 504]
MRIFNRGGIKMNVKSNVQKLGRAMLLPVAAMPISGIDHAFIS